MWPLYLVGCFIICWSSSSSYLVEIMAKQSVTERGEFGKHGIGAGGELPFFIDLDAIFRAELVFYSHFEFICWTGL